MSYFLYPKVLEKNQTIKLDGNELGHLFSRRVKPGEKMNLQGVDEKRFECEIVSVGKKEVSLKVLNEVLVPKELDVKITLFQSFVNEQALDFILQKSTELGANKIILFNSQNTASKLLSGIFEKKSVRWNKILWEAAKQCDRMHPPGLEFAEGVESVVAGLSKYEKIVLLDPKGESVKNSWQSWPINKSCAIIVGPEGGFTEVEVEKFKSLTNCSPVSLGPVLLRAETAALAGISAVRFMIN
jgi:16S rRNA (uracil1498-N3)-methyltransferase